LIPVPSNFPKGEKGTKGGKVAKDEKRRQRGKIEKDEKVPKGEKGAKDEKVVNSEKVAKRQKVIKSEKIANDQKVRHREKVEISFFRKLSERIGFLREKGKVFLITSVMIHNGRRNIRIDFEAITLEWLTFIGGLHFRWRERQLTLNLALAVRSSTEKRRSLSRK
jgi:hypothetical protein